MGIHTQGAVSTQSQNQWQIDTKDGHCLPEIACTVREASRTCKIIMVMLHAMMTNKDKVQIWTIHITCTVFIRL